jgi:HSP20 family molecular chaperone IbpA
MTLLDGNVWLSLASERGMPSATRPAEGGYPPYNIELVPGGEQGPETLRITLAVAGFGREELEVSVEGGELIVRGIKHDEGPKDYLHRGIAARQFRRTFSLAHGVEVRKAELHEGLLAIELMRPNREKRVHKVGIASAD